VAIKIIPINEDTPPWKIPGAYEPPGSYAPEDTNGVFNWGLEGVLRENNCILRVISRQLGASL
jgi:hypothetical protein